jgi:hypothetical protein
MRWEASVSLVACLFGILIPCAWIGYQLPTLMGLSMATIAVAPFALVALTSWTSRTDRRLSRGVMVVALMILAIALGGWWCFCSSREALFLLGVFCIPILQFLTWIFGALMISWLRGEPHEVVVCQK